MNNTLKANSNALRQYKKTIALNQMQREAPRATPVSFGLLWSTRRRLYTFKKGETYVACFISTNYCSIYMDIWHLYEIFSNFVGTPPRVHCIREMRFQTYSHPDFKFYDDLFYPAHEYRGCSRKKRVPENISELLTPRALAYWDDGSYTSKKNRTPRSGFFDSLFSFRRSSTFSRGCLHTIMTRQFWDSRYYSFITFLLYVIYS